MPVLEEDSLIFLDTMSDIFLSASVFLISLNNPFVMYMSLFPSLSKSATRLDQLQSVAAVPVN